MRYKEHRREVERAGKRKYKHGYSIALLDVLRLINIRHKQLMNSDWIKSEEERRILDVISNDIRQSALANDSFKSLRTKIKNRKLKNKQ